jgi:hypothetical protein
LNLYSNPTKSRIQTAFPLELIDFQSLLPSQPHPCQFQVKPLISHAKTPAPPFTDGFRFRFKKSRSNGKASTLEALYEITVFRSESDKTDVLILGKHPVTIDFNPLFTSLAQHIDANPVFGSVDQFQNLLLHPSQLAAAQVSLKSAELHWFPKILELSVDAGSPLVIADVVDYYCKHVSSST